jgi:hypothetical protein
MALLLLAVLWWPETEAGGGVADLSLDLGGLDLFLSPLSHHGGGLEERFHDEVVVVVSMEGHPGVVVLPRANHMANKFVIMICGKKKVTLLQPPVRRLSGSSAGARCRWRAKWCLPGLPPVASRRIYALE